MSIQKKMTDFVRLEQGSIGQKAAMVTGAAMVAIVLAAAADGGRAKAGVLICSDHSHSVRYHVNYTDYTNYKVSPHTNLPYSHNESATPIECYIG